MAQIFYGVNVAENDANQAVTVGTSDTSTDVQIVVITGGDVTAKLQIKNAAERLIRYIETEDTDTVWTV